MKGKARQVKVSSTAASSTSKLLLMKERDYSYTQFNKLDSEEVINIYGVITDATFPYKSKDGRYICHVKLIDQSYELTHSELSLLIISKDFDQMPIINRIGDILRVHRCERHEGKSKLIANMNYRSSWCLFISDAEDQPLEPKFLLPQGQKYTLYTSYSFNGQSYTLGAKSKEYLDEI
jgi:hypothetical protein